MNTFYNFYTFFSLSFYTFYINFFFRVINIIITNNQASSALVLPPSAQVRPRLVTPYARCLHAEASASHRVRCLLPRATARARGWPQRPRLAAKAPGVDNPI